MASKPTFKEASWTVALELVAKYRSEGLSWDQARNAWMRDGQPVMLGVAEWKYFAEAIATRTRCRLRKGTPTVWNKCQSYAGFRAIARHLKFLLAVGQQDAAKLKRENVQLQQRISMAEAEVRRLTGGIARLLAEPETF